MSRRRTTAHELSDAEKRDLTQLIQAGKPLPEKHMVAIDYTSFNDEFQHYSIARSAHLHKPRHFGSLWSF